MPNPFADISEAIANPRRSVTPRRVVVTPPAPVAVAGKPVPDTGWGGIDEEAEALQEAAQIHAAAPAGLLRRASGFRGGTLTPQEQELLSRMEPPPLNPLPQQAPFHPAPQQAPVQVQGAPPPVQIQAPDVEIPGLREPGKQIHRLTRNADGYQVGTGHVRGGYQVGNNLFSNRNDYESYAQRQRDNDLDNRTARILQNMRLAAGPQPTFMGMNPDGTSDHAGIFNAQQSASNQNQNMFTQALAQASQEERSRLTQALGLGDLAVRRGGLGLDAQKASADDATNRARIATTEGASVRDDATKRVGITSQEGISARDLEATRRRDEVNAEVGRGTLSLAQRKQLGDEQKQAWDMEQDKQGARIADAMAAQGRTPAEIRAYQNQRRKQFPGQTPPSQTPDGKTPDDKDKPPAPRSDSERFQTTFGDDLHLELEDIRTGKAGEGKSQVDRMKAAARLLARRVDVPENALLPGIPANQAENARRAGMSKAMIDYMKHNYGNDFDTFIRPSQTRQFANRLVSPLGIGDDEALASQFRQLSGEPEREMEGWERLLGTGLSFNPAAQAVGLGTAIKNLKAGKKEGQSRSSYLGDALLEVLPGRQAFKLW